MRPPHGTFNKGVSAVYKSLDIRDTAAVRWALDGHRVTGVVHGAGVLADRKIDDVAFHREFAKFLQHDLPPAQVTRK